MNRTLEQLAAGGSAAGSAVILLCGVLVTAALLWAIRLGIKVRRRESPPPRRGEHPVPPRSGPVGEERNMREPNEVPRTTEKGDRRTPHELGNAPSRPSTDQTRPRWDE
ncbi:DUF6479 family protein [Streptomyces sp. NPDC096198]|uniref:DUF6479 family protein n=1 Tax=Streptomyces sp. NPDC096198 TaxID=3366080 RepID=UPI0037F40B2E